MKNVATHHADGPPAWTGRQAGSSVWNCPRCGEAKSTVTDSRPGPSGVRRRRHCLACNWRHTTIEVNASVIDDIGKLVDSRQAIKVAIETLQAALASVEKLIKGDVP